MAKAVLASYVGLVAVTVLATLVEVPVYAHMMTCAMLVIYIGCYNSVDSKKDADSGMESMTTKDAYMFPVWGSAFLFSFYLLFKFLPKEYINLAIKAYFFVLGVLVLASFIFKFLTLLLPKTFVKTYEKPLVRVWIPIVGAWLAPTPKPGPDGKEPKSDGKIEISWLDLFCYAIAGCFGAMYLRTNHWALSNLFGIAFSVQGIEMLSLGTYFNAMIMLCGLFVYDVFWVFGTDVMVTVAKSFDAPIKLLFPRQMGAVRPSMLGLGDIVVPGLFIALLLRFDHYLHLKHKRGANATPVYFYATLFGYWLGLTTTVLVMYYFNAAQPALLYLVPTCLGSSMITAVVRGEFSELWNFSEEEDEKKTAEAKKEPKKTK